LSRKFKSIRVTDKIPPVGREIYFMAKRIDDFDSDGSFLLATMRVYKYYLPSYKQHYYESMKSMEDLYTAVNLANILRSENIELPYIPIVSIDFECFKSIYDTDIDGIVPMPSHNDRSLGRHAVQVINVDKDSSSIMFPNSWGNKWGKDGFGFLSSDYLNRYLKEICFAMDASVGIDDEKIERIKNTQDCNEIAGIWMEKNEKDSIDTDLNGKKLNIVWYSLRNMSGPFVEIFDLRTFEGQRLGWAHLTHSHNDGDTVKKSCITELFIWPTFRKKGYGTLLENYCVENALRMDSSILQISLYEMDDLKGIDSPVRLFASKLGYVCILKPEILPCINGFAEKKI
jgi:GNAT superfamily N-acetyltransferase